MGSCALSKGKHNHIFHEQLSRLEFLGKILRKHNTR